MEIVGQEEAHQIATRRGLVRPPVIYRRSREAHTYRQHGKPLFRPTGSLPQSRSTRQYCIQLL